MTNLRNGFRIWWFLTAGVLFLAILFIIRYPTDRDTLRVFFRAGPNVLELIKTLDHFRKDPDPLKFESAKFLIRHMGLHHYREDGYSDKKIEWFAEHYHEVIDGLKKTDDSLELAWAGLKENYHPKKIRDARGIKSIFLIDHIDQAFETWNSSPWSDHFSFDQFCEHFLPYKTNEGPMALWLDYYRERYGHIVNNQGDSIDTREFIFQLISESKTRYKTYQPVLRRNCNALEMDQAPTGDCRFLADWQGYIFRSMGLPATVINSVWAYAGEGHYWNAWMDKSGNWREILKRGDSIILWEATPPKIFARHWGKQDDSFRAIAEKNKLQAEHIPSKLLAWNLVDITGDIIPTSDITVSLNRHAKNQNNPFVYLAVSDNNDWEPLHWAFLEGSEATFTQMGRNMLYLPIFYENGQIIPAGEAFIISDRGEILNVDPDTSQWITLDIDRVYPLRQWVMHKHARQMISGTIEGSNYMEFPDPDTLFHIDTMFLSTPSFYEAPELKGRWTYDKWWQEIEVNTSSEYRYVRYRAGIDKSCIIGDLEVYGENGRKLEPVSFFGRGDNPGFLNDGVPGQYFDSPKPGSWAAMDLGTPAKITRIRFIPHDIDPASIKAGDEYQLYFWNGDDWNPILKIRAENKSIPIQIHPFGLYLLEDLSRFVHRRPFWYNPEKGIVEWW